MRMKDTDRAPNSPKSSFIMCSVCKSVEILILGSQNDKGAEVPKPLV